MTAVLLALLAAASLAVGYGLTKHVVRRYPPRQLIGPLYGLNALLLVPAVPFATWRWSWHVAFLFAVSVLAMLGVSISIFDLMVHGSASSVATGQAMSPLPAVLLTALLLPGGVSAVDGAVAAVVVAAVLVALGDAFGPLGRLRVGLTVVLGAAAAGLLTVVTALQTREGLGIVEIYVVRTSAAALLWLVLAPPRDIPLRAVPTMSIRAGFLTFHFALVIAAVERGSPATVQTIVATAPLLLLLGTFVLGGERPPARVVVAAAVVTAGVLLVLAT